MTSQQMISNSVGAQPADDLRHALDDAPSAYWPKTLLLIGAVVALRLIYLIWLSPYQLLGDEAYYWEQARHPDLCYNEKGPILAWMIWLCCRLFGDTEWAVRLPMVIAFTISTWAIARLTLSVTRSTRAAFYAVVCFCLIPAFEANAQICTQDGPLITVWITLSAIGLRLFRRWHDGKSTWNEWLLLYTVLGLGFDLKQSILTFMPSLVIYAWLQRRTLRFSWLLLLQQFIGAIVFGILILPMLIWNARHGWPMLAHTLGHLGAGGDQAGLVNRGNFLTWSSSFFGGVLFAMGPAFVGLTIWGWKMARSKQQMDPQAWQDRCWLICAALPTMIFFLLLSFTKPVLASWPLPTFVPLVVLIGEIADVELKRFNRLLRTWKRSKAMHAAGIARPDTPFNRLWKLFAAYGIGGSLLIAFPTPLHYLPIVGAHLDHSLFKRFTGHREDAAALNAVRTKIAQSSDSPPLLVTRHYMEAALYAFYLPDHPVVHTAGKYLGKRSTTFDQWADTRLDNPSLYGRTLLLDGQGDVTWDKGLRFDAISPLADGRFYLATNYQGPQPNHPELVDGEE